MDIRLLTSDDLRRCLSMSRAITLMEEAFRALSQGRVVAPRRTNITNDLGTLLYKPAMHESSGIFCLKAVSVFPDNGARGLPVTTGVVLVNDVSTGLPLAMMDAEYLTALRTGAATGLATRLMAPPDARMAVVFGAGGQARCQLAGLLAVAELERIYVFGRRHDRLLEFCRSVEPEFGRGRIVAATDRRALADADIVCTATTAASPLFADAEIGSRVHINGIGSFTPMMAEIPAETVVRAWVCVDQREACLAESGDLRGPIDAGLLSADFHPPELGELVDGRVTIPRDGVTLFKSVGNAAQDVFCAAEALAVARRDGIGETVSV